VPSFQQDCFEAGLGQTSVQPLGQRAGLKADPLDRDPEFSQKRDEGVGSLATLASLTILPLASTRQTLESSKDTSIPT
jgi:hypothetical protein